MRPVEQVPLYGKGAERGEVRQSQQQRHTEVQQATLNDMFRKNTTGLNFNTSNMSQSRKSLGRTEKSRNKR